MSGRTRVLALLGRVSRWEVAAAGLAAVVLVVLVAIEPDILRAPFASTRAAVFSFGGTAVAAAVLAVLLALRVPPPVRLLVLGAPFVAVSWWLLSPYFVDDVVDERFDVSIAAAATATSAPRPTIAATPETARPQATAPVTTAPITTAPITTGAVTTTTAASPPVLLGAGRFAGLAGHEGTGDAGLFRTADGAHVLRFENFDIQNGPDLRVYLVPGPGRTEIAGGSVSLGKLKGNVGDQTYALPASFVPSGTAWTALVWCEAFSVEFVAATIDLA